MITTYSHLKSKEAIFAEMAKIGGHGTRIIVSSLTPAEGTIRRTLTHITAESSSSQNGETTSDSTSAMEGVQGGEERGLKSEDKEEEEDDGLTEAERAERNREIGVSEWDFNTKGACQSFLGIIPLFSSSPCCYASFFIAVPSLLLLFFFSAPSYNLISPHPCFSLL